MTYGRVPWHACERLLMYLIYIYQEWAFKRHTFSLSNGILDELTFFHVLLLSTCSFYVRLSIFTAFRSHGTFPIHWMMLVMFVSVFFFIIRKTYIQPVVCRYLYHIFSVKCLVNWIKKSKSWTRFRSKVNVSTCFEIRMLLVKIGNLYHFDAYCHNSFGVCVWIEAL